MERFLLNKQVDNSSEADQASTSGGGVKRRKYRKYDDSYLDFGFTSIEMNNEERPQCVLCLKILSTESMLPSKLKRHLETNHPNMVEKSREFFQRKLQNLRKQKNLFTEQASVPRNALLASYKVAYRVARCKKPHTIAEELILPACLDMVNIMIGESAGKLISKVPLSNNTISRRIHDIAKDISDQLIEKIKDREFGLQLDEATDSNEDAHLIYYVRFLNDDTMVEDLLFCKSIIESAKAQDLFEILDQFITGNDLDWNMCIGVCTDGARSMSGIYGGLQALIRKKAPHAIWTHCIIHREALASKSVSSELNLVLQQVIDVVNYIKTRPLKARVFKKLCTDMGAEHTALLYYCSSRWLSRGNVLSRVFELHQEIHIFLQEESHTYSRHFANPEFLMKLAYLSDIFDKLNALNMSLQGNNMHILKSSYLCEAGFSAVAVIKSKYRSKINVEQEMRVAVSSLIPRFEKMCGDHQAHTSH